jgi:asparagine synthetase B (glutamine-hydrolysing)
MHISVTIYVDTNVFGIFRWKLVEIDADLSKLGFETKRVMSLINPADTYMDLNIGTALWLAARGDGWIHEDNGNPSVEENNQRVKYKSDARILLVGAGADEQCAGYGRHRTKYRNGRYMIHLCIHFLWM